MYSKEPDIKKAVKLLEQDLKYGPYHCFGLHEKCSTDFCLSAKEMVASVTQDPPDVAVDDNSPDNNVIYTIRCTLGRNFSHVDSLFA